MLVPAGVILIWDGTNASIPTSWQRETSLDDKYAKATAAGIDPNVTGGSHTHSHTSPEHTHTNSHVHTGRSHDADTSGGWSVPCDNSLANHSGCQAFHYHNFTSNNPTDGSLIDAIAYASVNQEPPHRKIIFIKPSQGLSPLRDDIIALYSGASVPAGWTFCDTTGGTPDLRNRYLKGAAAGADSDVSTDNGALTHVHDVGHTHAATNHTHYILTDGATADERSTVSGSNINEKGHQHGATLAAVSQAGGAYTGTVTSDAVEPAYKKLLAIKNTTGSVSMPKGIIGMWLGSLATIPIGWVLCDGNNGTQDMRDYHLKIANALAEVGDIGGANTHIHAASNSHSHAGASHGHTVPTMSQEAGTRDPNDSTFSAIQHHHVHPSDNGRVDAATTVYNSTTISGDSSNNEPAYRTVAFIQYVFSTGGAMLFNIV